MIELIILLRLHKICVEELFCGILDADIIIFVKKDQLLDEAWVFNKEKQFLNSIPETYEPQDVEDVKKEIILRVNELKNSYIKIDEFDLDFSNITDDDHIIVLGKKNIFEDNNELKYKYRFLKN